MTSNPTIKNAHSPAGMRFSTGGVSHVHDIDCPRCRYGTLTGCRVGMVCIDCHAVFSREWLIEHKIINNSAAYTFTDPYQYTK